MAGPGVETQSSRRANRRVRRETKGPFLDAASHGYRRHFEMSCASSTSGRTGCAKLLSSRTNLTAYRIFPTSILSATSAFFLRSVLALLSMIQSANMIGAIASTADSGPRKRCTLLSRRAGGPTSDQGPWRRPMIFDWPTHPPGKKCTR